MTSVLVIGRSGQLATSLGERAPAVGVRAHFAGRGEIDLASVASIRSLIRATKASVVVNAAAYTNVDLAEDQPERAYALNAHAPAVIADAARDADVSLVHISTDYVFAGTGTRPWVETDVPGPVNVYGQSKLAGEAAVRARLDAYAILRTSWVYSPFGANFVKTMLRVAQTTSECKVVADQVGNPTSALDLAEAILTMIIQWEQEPSRGLGETYHFAGTGATSWAGFADAIFTCSREFGGPSARVEPIPSSAWPAQAQRPAHSRLSTEKFEGVFGHRPPRWQRSLRQVVKRLVGAPSL